MFDTWSIWVYKFPRCLFFHQIGIALVPLGSPPHRLHAATPIKQICQRGRLFVMIHGIREQLDPKNAPPQKIALLIQKYCCFFKKMVSMIIVLVVFSLSVHNAFLHKTFCEFEKTSTNLNFPVIQRIPFPWLGPWSLISKAAKPNSFAVLRLRWERESVLEKRK